MYPKKFPILLHFILVALYSLIKLVCNLVEFIYWQITYTTTTPEVTFTGDTMSDFILDKANIDVLRARILVVEVLYWDSFIFATSELEILVCFALLNFRDESVLLGNHKLLKRQTQNSNGKPLP